MDIKNALRFASKKFSKKKLLSLSAHLDAEILLSYVFKKDKSFLHTYPEKKLNALQKKIFLRLVHRRLKYEPIAYITKEKEFYKRKFFVNKYVLIPRPETECAVEEAIQALKNISKNNKNITIADIGTGSGAIAITLVKELKNVKILATDISKKALRVAKTNSDAYGANIHFYQGNLIEPIKNKKIDILVANLPYLDAFENHIYGKILKLEPKIALFAKEKGLKAYKDLFLQMKKYSFYPKIVICEIGHKQNVLLKKYIKKIIPRYQVVFKKDLSLRLRIAVMKKTSSR